jgi:DHA1 family inner membrane transport protein
MATEAQVVASPAVRSTPAARRTAALILALIFSLTLVLSAIVPLLPRFVDRFHLSTVEAGALFSIVTGVMVAASLPVGLLADRFGPRPLALGAVVFLVGSCFLQGLASSYGMLLAGRAVFGIAHTTIWASTLVWLTQLDLSPRARPMLLGGTMTVSGAGFSVGPFLVGFLADRFGIFVPFAAAAAFATLVALRLARAPAPPRLAAEERPRLRETVQSVRRDPYVSAALLILVTAGGMMIGVSLLIPLQLHHNGFSAGKIGAVFSVAGAMSVLVSATVNRLGERAAKPLVAAACLAWLALVPLLPATSESTVAILVYLAISGWASTTVVTIPYPIGGEGARRNGIPRGAVMGGLNTAWALSATVAPLLGGAIAQSLGYRDAWLAVSIVMATGSLLVFRLARRSRRRAG